MKSLEDFNHLLSLDRRYTKTESEIFRFPAGCSAWVILRRVREGLPQFPNALLFGIAEEAWVDGDLWREGRPLPEEDLPLFKRRLRYEAGGAWYASKGRERVLQGAQGGRTG